MRKSGHAQFFARTFRVAVLVATLFVLSSTPALAEPIKLSQVVLAKVVIFANGAWADIATNDHSYAKYSSSFLEQMKLRCPNDFGGLEHKNVTDVSVPEYDGRLVYEPNIRVSSASQTAINLSNREIASLPAVNQAARAPLRVSVSRIVLVLFIVVPIAVLLFIGLIIWLLIRVIKYFERRQRRYTPVFDPTQSTTIGGFYVPRAPDAGYDTPGRVVNRIGELRGPRDPRSAKNEPATIYCSWCAKSRLSDSDEIHHCGSRERPTEYCSKCVTHYNDDPSICFRCGASRKLISPA